MEPPADGFAALDTLVRKSPFHQWLGVRLHRLEPEAVELLLPWRAELTCPSF